MFAFSGFSAMSDMEVYLRTPFFRVLSRLTLYNVIGGGSEVVGEYFHLFPLYMAWFFSSAWSTNHVGSILSFLWVALLLCSSVGGFLFSRGLQSSRKDRFALVRGVLESLLPSFYYRCPLTKKVSMGHFYYLQRYLECNFLSSFSVRRRWLKWS